MGCGKSKHDVVAGNTISQSKKSKDDHANDAENTKPAPETTSIQQEANQRGNEDAGRVVDVKQSEKAKGGSEKAEVQVEGGKVKESEIEKEDLKVDNVVKKSENVKVDVEVEKAKETKVVIVAEDLKEKVEIKDLKGENVEEAKSEKVGVTEEQGQGKMIPSDSQSHLYDAGNIDGVISEGLSGATVYYSPPHTKEESPKLDNVVNVVEEKESTEETKKETTNEEIVEVTEEACIKEEVIPTVDTKVSSNINAESEKAVISANEANVAETTGEEDSKTN